MEFDYSQPAPPGIEIILLIERLKVQTSQLLAPEIATLQHRAGGMRIIGSLPWLRGKDSLILGAGDRGMAYILT